MDDSTGLTVAAMTQAVGVSAHTLRYWERAGLITPISRDSGGRRRYGPTDIAWVQFLLRLRETGMSVVQMRQYAGLRAQGDATIQARIDMLVQHREALHQQLARLRSHEKALDAKIDTYQKALEQNRDPS